MDLSHIAATAITALAPIFTAVLTLAAGWLVALVRARAKNACLNGVLVRLNEAVVTAVKELQQVLVDGIKEANADGAISEDEKKEIKRRAMDAVKAYLGRKGLMELVKVLGLQGYALDNLLSAKVEAAVHDLHAAEPMQLKAELLQAEPVVPSLFDR